MSHEAAITKDKPRFPERRTDRGEGITFKKYLFKFYSKGERNKLAKCEQCSRKTFSDWKLLALTQKNMLTRNINQHYSFPLEAV